MYVHAPAISTQCFPREKRKRGESGAPPNKIRNKEVISLYFYKILNRREPVKALVVERYEREKIQNILDPCGGGSNPTLKRNIRENRIGKTLQYHNISIQSVFVEEAKACLPPCTVKKVTGASTIITLAAIQVFTLSLCFPFLPLARQI